MDYTPNFHAIRVRYNGPTETRGARITLISDRFNDSVTLSYDHGIGNALEQAIKWLVGLGVDVVGRAELRHEYIILTSTFMAVSAIRNGYVPLEEV